VRSPSADLLDTLYTMQQRQWWLRETLVEAGAEPLGVVGSARLSEAPESVALAMREALGFHSGWARGVNTWKDAISALLHAIQDLGVMAVINGVVGNNTHRKLDVAEFRGFALCDPYAPLIFVNGADTKSAQIFTLAHELAHVWIGREGLSGFEDLFPDHGDVERFCNHVAAEFLVPARELEACWAEALAAAQPYEFLARRFKVSPIVAARRAMDLRLISREAFFAFYKDYTAQERHLEMRRKEQGKGGGDFYNNQNTRVGERFALEVFRAAKEGRVMYTEAYRLTGLQGAAFRNYAQALGIEV
jgi:Zn-dependent peptidase ImmA (M78 family)